MEQPLLQVEVLGTPEPAGSKKAFVPRRRDGSYVYRPNGTLMINVTDDNAKSKPWKQQVGLTARAAWGSRPVLTEPLALELIFVVARTKDHYRTGQYAGYLKHWAAKALPSKKPDVLKLARAVEDALTGIVYMDDAQIVDERLIKVYGAPERVIIRVARPAESLAALAGDAVEGDAEEAQLRIAA